jgi:hypothetical protein
MTGYPYKYNLHDYDEVERKWREHEEKEGWEPSAKWTRVQDLPDTTQILLGGVIKGCWTKRYYPSMTELCQAIEQCSCKDGRTAKFPK